MENKSIKYPIIHYTGGCMYVEPLQVDGKYVKGYTWQVRVTKEVTGILKECQDGLHALDVVKIPVGVYPFTKRTSETPEYKDEVFLYDMFNKRFTFKRFVNDLSDSLSASYVSLMSVGWYNENSWPIWEPLPGLVRFYGYDESSQSKFRLKHCSDTFIDISKIYSPNEYIHWGEVAGLYTEDGVRKDVTVFFPEGEYFGNYHYSNIWGKYTHVTVKGDGPERTVFRYADQNGNDLHSEYSESSNVIFKDMKLLNHSFHQYYLYGNKDKGVLEFHNVHLELTLNGGHPYVFVLYQENLRFRFINSKLIAKGVSYGIFIEGPKDYLIENSYFEGGNWQSAIHIRSSNGGIVRGCTVIDGITGIFHCSNKKYSIERAIVENCVLEGQSEESISFDCFGNNVDLNPYICECSVEEETEITENKSTFLRLKVGKIRRIEGQHESQYYIVDEESDRRKNEPDRLLDAMGKCNAEWMAENKEYLSDFHVVFNTNAGDGYTGTFAKIRRLEVVGNKIYIVLERKMNQIGVIAPGAPFSSLAMGRDKYTVTISSGFYYCKVLNNRVRNNPGAGVALYGAFYGGIMSGNVIQNCGNAYLSGNHMYLGVNNGAYGNIITDNILTDVKHKDPNLSGLKVATGLGDLNCYNNIVSNNMLVNSDLTVRKVHNCKVDGNNIQNGKITIIEAQTTSFGEAAHRPTAALPGQTYYNQSSQQLEMWTGTEWIVK